MSELHESLHYDEVEDRLTILTVQDVEPILEANKRAMANSDGKYRSEVFNKVASIPEVVAIDWCRKNGVTMTEFYSDPKIVLRLLNDPDYKLCRTMGGKL